MSILQKTDIRTCWVMLKPLLEEVKRERGGSWRPEDVYAECVNGSGFLYLADDAFVVLKPMLDDYSRETFLLVWIAYGVSCDTLDRYQDQVIEIARLHGYERLQFWRRPRGDVDSRGWVKRYTIYEMEI